MRQVPLIFVILFSTCVFTQGNGALYKIADWEELKKLDFTCRFTPIKNAKQTPGNKGVEYVPAYRVTIIAPNAFKFWDGKVYPFSRIEYQYGFDPIIISCDLKISNAHKDRSEASVSFAESALQDSFIYVSYSSPDTSNTVFCKLYLKVLLDRKSNQANPQEKNIEETKPDPKNFKIKIK